MATPAFIYAFDNLSPSQFTTLCGLLLANRYKGFLLGGVGSDGGVDAEIDEQIGEWKPETSEPLLNEIVQLGHTVIFQFKHIVTARRGGQAESRRALMGIFRSSKNKKSELHSHLIQLKQPNVYVLVTNVEVNSEFRNSFIDTCKIEEKSISHYQIIGLDELEMWLSAQPQLGHMYFPAIFGPPRFDLRLQLGEGFTTEKGDIKGPALALFQISIMNFGLSASYVSGINFKNINENGATEVFKFIHQLNPLYSLLNQEVFAGIQPGRRVTYHLPFTVIGSEIRRRNVMPIEVTVVDELGNTYSALIPEYLREKILQS